MSEIKAWRYEWRLTKKILVERKLEDHRSIEWGILLMDNNGMIAIVSDYANGVHHWPFNSEKHLYNNDFRNFILSCDIEYLIRKMFNENTCKENSVTATVAYLKERIISDRKDKSLDKDEAREEWHYMQQLADGDIDFEGWYHRTNYDGTEMIMREYTPDIQHLKKYIWPEFKRLIREDLLAEKQPVSTGCMG